MAEIRVLDNKVHLADLFQDDERLLEMSAVYAEAFGEALVKAAKEARNFPIAGEAPNACCRENANLKEIERQQARYGDGSEAGPLIVYQCQVCQRKHYVHEVKPFHVGLAMKSA